MADFRLPDSTHLGGVRLRVSNLARSLDFYRDVLGLSVRGQSGGEARLAAVDQGPVLVTLVEEPRAVPKPPGTTGLFHVAIRLPDRASLGRLLSRLWAQGWPLQGAADHGVSEALYLGDPDHNGLELYCDRPRAEWDWEGDQIKMVTERLNLNDLIAQASDAPWDGIAPGTDIGHVHLSVSHLPRTEAFYSGLLGFDVMQRSYPGALFLAAGGYHHHLGTNTWGAPRLAPPPPDAADLLDFEVVIPDVWAWQTACARLEQGGVARESQGGDGLPRATFRDPDGIGVVLVGVP